MTLAIAGGTLWRAVAVVGLALIVAALLWLLGRAPHRSAQSFLDHLEELRRRVVLSLAVVLSTMAFLFSFAWTGTWPRPALHDNLAAQLFVTVRDDLVPDDVLLVVSRPMDGFVAEATVALGAALLLTSPFWIWQIGGFLWPALRPQEQRTVLQAFVPMLVLFLAGAAFAYIYVIPFLLETLYAYGAALGAQGLLPVSEFVSFVLGLVVVMGLAFQTPLVMWTLTRTGLVAAASWRRYWRHATIAILVVSALVTDPTIISQLLVAAPLMLLYVAGIGLSIHAQRLRDAA